MKSLFTTLLILFLSIAAFGQVKERMESMSLGSQNALVLTIPQTDQKLVEDTWVEFTKDEFNNKAKWDRKTKEFFCDDVDIRTLGPNTVDVHAQVSQRGSDAEMIVWFNLGGAFLSSRMHRDLYPEAEKIMMRFGLAVAAAKTELELKEEEKNLKQLERELDRLQKDNERFHKDIEKAQEAIKEAEKSIAENEVGQENMREQIRAQEKLIEEVKKKLKDLQ